MVIRKIPLRRTVVAAALSTVLAGLGTGTATATASAADWPPLREGAHLYTGTHGTGTVSRVDLDDVGTCHTSSAPSRSVQVVTGSSSVVLYPGADCTGASPWSTGSLARADLPWAAWSYRVVPA
ncbi:hypothetical protein GCM10018785_31740 [Streptomyces longispororuber]|uniref:Uncharacterized protein n=1 Tax=Streptomyces longispororuber TaxID=68230 RepID=A0A918ZM24_9ACTN|nr:hypothetical protein [Streptomyces longispororuber]GHE60305.1 hypothetical protein GCM10018785_31740 [Streptomyces longispororuber]